VRDAASSEPARRTAFLLVLLATLTACGGRSPAPPSPADPESCCREFEYLLEATILKIDVARLFLRVDQETARQVAAIVSTDGRTRESELAVSNRLMSTGDAYARLTFLLDISAQQFQETTEKTLRDLGLAGYLKQDEVDQLVQSSRRDLTFLGDSGITKGDYIEQMLSADSVTTTFANSSGERRFQSIRIGREHRIAMLGSYFAETSDFRAGLLDQVFGHSRDMDPPTLPVLSAAAVSRPRQEVAR
jgi:hypothetical protein